MISPQIVGAKILNLLQTRMYRSSARSVPCRESLSELSSEKSEPLSPGSGTDDDGNTDDVEAFRDRRRKLLRASSQGVVPENIDGIADNREDENEVRLEKSRASKSVTDPNLVSWDGPNDPMNPKNWSIGRKWAAILVVSAFTFISPVSSSMVAPALNSMAQDLHITDTVLQAMTLSIFLLAYGVGPLFMGPLSEIYGRAIVLQIGNLFYLVFNLACGFAKTQNQMIIFRFLAGLGGSAPLAIGGGVLSDVFDATQRGKAVSIYSLAPLLGPAVGPIAGGFITENTTWRWVFWATTICDALIQLGGLWLLQETYAPVILHRKKIALIEETGNEDMHTAFDHPERRLAATLRIALFRPFKLLGTQIIVQVLAVYMAYIYGLMYLVLSTFPDLWEVRYHRSIATGGLNYISLGAGFFLGSQIGARLQDKIYLNLKKKNNGVGLPEFRVPLMVPGALFVPIGLFWYGWTAQAHLHWIMPNIGAAIFAAGTIIQFQSMQVYIIDSYTTYAASAIGAATVLRSLCAFGFPLWASYLYDALDYGWGNSVLGFVAVVLGWPAPLLLWKFGASLRKKSTFAAG
ncbi:MFS multidrug transporter-like protein [Calycina marina]|uniref:MFS multidrug transporter-like protein n=1 Tax=Calycina marina TaxID=1763456 RepID=A0A9P7Z8B3_9HELO|nr:MFS multidrug transporter-like protein [Calycina marina]